MLRLQALDNPNVVTAALNELQAVPDTPLLQDLLGVADADSRPHYEPLRTTIQARISASRQGTEGVATEQSNGSVDGLPKGSVNGAANDPRTVGQTQALPSRASPILTPPSPTKPEGREVEICDDSGVAVFHEVWEAVRHTVLEKWHFGSEKIAVGNGNPVGMGAERLNVLELVQRYGAEETTGAIHVGPRLFGFEEPTSLRWYTSREHGPANFNQAVGQWHKTQGGGA